MPQRTWKFKANKREHTAWFKTGGIRSMPTLTVDDQPVELAQQPKVGRFPMFTDFTGKFHSHDILVRMSTNGFVNFYELAVDGISQKTGKLLTPGPVIPTWSWIFFALAIAVAFANINNFVLSIVALVTGFSIMAIASDTKLKFQLKLLACAALTIIAWAFYFLKF